MAVLNIYQIKHLHFIIKHFTVHAESNHPFNFFHLISKMYNTNILQYATSGQNNS